MSGHGLADLWHGLADVLDDLPAVSCGDRVRTWGEAEERASRLAGHLLAAGLVPGDRVAVGLRNSVEHMEVMFALFKAGLTPVNLNVRYRAGELRHLLTDSGARGLVVGASVVPVAAEAAEGTEARVARVAIPDVAVESGDSLGSGFVWYESALAAAEPAPRRPGSADEQIILYTGGTTGRPKGTVWRQGEIIGVGANEYRRRELEPPETLADALRIAAELGRAAERPVLMPASPVLHGTGMFAMFGALGVGAEVALLAGASFSAKELWETVVRRRVNEIVIIGDVQCTPMVEELDRAVAAGTPYDLSSLRQVRSAGMRWSAGPKLALLRHADIRCMDVIASSEGGPYGILTTVRGDDPETSRFMLAPNARVIGEDGRDVVPGSGEVGLLAAPGRMPLGYLGDPDKTAATFRVIDGVRYAMPGDRAILHEDGSLTLLGRASGVINSGGEKIDAEEVEGVLIEHPAVADAVLVGVPHPRWGQTPHAIVVLKQGAAATEEDLIEHVRANLASYKKPTRVLFVDELVRTAAGKADRRWAGEYAKEAAQTALA
ncbi:AMP-binding protein [Thermopolyspora sp. NPDC052614]|uniref:AMP-binding protein n=1 Tax=Thermopolyspora sp. NPDC052614 TaxID=3155682 RepID=UPI003445C638